MDAGSDMTTPTACPRVIGEAANQRPGRWLADKQRIRLSQACVIV